VLARPSPVPDKPPRAWTAALPLTRWWWLPVRRPVPYGTATHSPEW